MTPEEQTESRVRTLTDITDNARYFTNDDYNQQLLRVAMGIAPSRKIPERLLEATRLAGQASDRYGNGRLTPDQLVTLIGSYSMLAPKPGRPVKLSAEEENVDGGS